MCLREIWATVHMVDFIIDKIRPGISHTFLKVLRGPLNVKVRRAMMVSCLSFCQTFSQVTRSTSEAEIKLYSGYMLPEGFMAITGLFGKHCELCYSM